MTSAPAVRTNPNGVPDSQLSEHEAELWLLSANERKRGDRVRYDAEACLWVRAGQIHDLTKPATCSRLRCGKSFRALRSTAKWCSEACKQKAASERVGHAKTA